MSSAGDRAALVARPAFDLDTAAWMAWLREHVDPGWRPGEWGSP